MPPEVCFTVTCTVMMHAEKQSMDDALIIAWAAMDEKKKTT